MARCDGVEDCNTLERIHCLFNFNLRFFSLSLILSPFFWVNIPAWPTLSFCCRCGCNVWWCSSKLKWAYYIKYSIYNKNMSCHDLGMYIFTETILKNWNYILTILYFFYLKLLINEVNNSTLLQVYKAVKNRNIILVIYSIKMATAPKVHCIYLWIKIKYWKITMLCNRVELLSLTEHSLTIIHLKHMNKRYDITNHFRHHY